MEPNRAGCGVEVLAHGLLTDAAEVDYLVVVAGQLPRSLEHPQATLGYLRGHWLLVNTTRSVTRIAPERGFFHTSRFSRWSAGTCGERMTGSRLNSPSAFRASIRAARSLA